MGALIYSAIASLDGYINDAEGSYGWAEPGEDLVDFLNEQLAGVGTYLYGRRMYEEMAIWETNPEAATWSPASGRFAEMWAQADKVVFSRTLDAPVTQRTRIVKEFDPALVERLKADAAGELTIDGATIAAPALLAGLVDEVHRFVVPRAVGAGTPMFPPAWNARLRLAERRSFDKGIEMLRYEVLPD